MSSRDRRPTVYYLGIDPGLSGGIAALSSEGDATAWEMPATERATAKLFREELPAVVSIELCLIERVHAFPAEGVHSVFAFARNAGFLLGLLWAFDVPFEEINPEVWQRALGVPPRRKRPRGRTMIDFPMPESKREFKARLRNLARATYPGMRITSKTADALLIASVASRMRQGVTTVR